MLMQIITTRLVFVYVSPEAQLIAVGLVLILAAVIDQTGALFSGRRFVTLLFTTRSKKVERALNVVLGCALVAVLAAIPRTPPGAPKCLPRSRPRARRSEDAATQHYVMIAAATGGPYWIDSKAGLEDKAKELGVVAKFTGPPTIDVNQQIDLRRPAPLRSTLTGSSWSPMSDGVTPAIDKAVEGASPSLRRCRTLRRASGSALWAPATTTPGIKAASGWRDC